jgi:hypothetical protein
MMKRRAKLLACVGWMAAFAGAAPAPSGPPGAIDVALGRTVVISSSKRYCWYPTVHRFSTGVLLVTMRMSPDELHPEGEFSGYCLSRDGGGSWSPRIPMGAGGNIDAAYTQGSPADGTLLSLNAGYCSPLPYPPGQARAFHVALTRYARDGMEVTQMRDALLCLRADVHLAPTQLFDLGTPDTSSLEAAPEVTPFGSIVDSRDGGLLTTVYYVEAAGLRQDLVIAHSRDGGRSWAEEGRVMAVASSEKNTGWMGDEGPNEAALARLADGRLFVLFRTGGNGFLGESWSSDDGRTWSAPVPSGFKGVAPHVRLLADGILVCTTGRPGPVTLRFSLDGDGSRWTQATEVFRGSSSCYSDLVEVEPGRLFVVYDSVPYGWRPIPATDKPARNTILGTWVEVRARAAH